MYLQQASPLVQFEDSPVESFVSTPRDSYSSLFATNNTSDTTSAPTMDPMEMLTPPRDERSETPSALADGECDGDDTLEDPSTPSSSDKKQTKKRKSWGQVLPEPKTNLPPRKRAKTEDEKEQRRVERVLRNRRAAQSSRERKRLEVEALEKRNQELEAKLRDAQKTNMMMFEQLQAFRQQAGLAAHSSTLLDSVRDKTVALSQELFSSQDQFEVKTLDPASLSPEMSPVPEVSEATIKQEPGSLDAQLSEKASAPPSDVAQHPAAMLFDLPCHMSEVQPSARPSSQSTTPPLLAWFLQFRMLLLSASTILSVCQRPLTQIAMSSKAGFSLHPTPQLLTTIIWLVTLPRPSPSTSTTSSTTRQATPPQNLWQRATAPLRTTGSNAGSPTLRLKSLRKILSSSPNLARPLLDATMVALRLVSEGRDDRVSGASRRGSSATRDVDRELTDSLGQLPCLPSKELLLTLAWTLRVEERRLQRRSKRHVPAPERNASAADKLKPTNQSYIIKST